MIQSFKNKSTEIIFLGKAEKRFPPKIQRVAQRKLLMLHATTMLQDLKVPPGNKLEKLKGDRKNQYSIRINDQWRICFSWKNGNAHDVEITDYHK